uniref:Octapeptide-repeat protein T2 n=2 Tax=Macrostomum lignano TaxID=282301 RepID=A0A1I8I965_9PLAT
ASVDAGGQRRRWLTSVTLRPQPLFRQSAAQAATFLTVKGRRGDEIFLHRKFPTNAPKCGGRRAIAAAARPQCRFVGSCKSFKCLVSSISPRPANLASCSPEAASFGKRRQAESFRLKIFQRPEHSHARVARVNRDVGARIRAPDHLPDGQGGLNAIWRVLEDQHSGRVNRGRVEPVSSHQEAVGRRLAMAHSWVAASQHPVMEFAQQLRPAANFDVKASLVRPGGDAHGHPVLPQVLQETNKGDKTDEAKDAEQRHETETQSGQLRANDDKRQGRRDTARRAKQAGGRNRQGSAQGGDRTARSAKAENGAARQAEKGATRQGRRRRSAPGGERRKSAKAEDGAARQAKERRHAPRQETATGRHGRERRHAPRQRTAPRAKAGNGDRAPRQGTAPRAKAENGATRQGRKRRHAPGRNGAARQAETRRGAKAGNGAARQAENGAARQTGRREGTGAEAPNRQGGEDQRGSAQQAGRREPARKAENSGATGTRGQQGPQERALLRATTSDDSRRRAKTSRAVRTPGPDVAQALAALRTVRQKRGRPALSHEPAELSRISLTLGCELAGLSRISLTLAAGRLSRSLDGACLCAGSAEQESRIGFVVQLKRLPRGSTMGDAYGFYRQQRSCRTTTSLEKMLQLLLLLLTALLSLIEVGSATACHTSVYCPSDSDFCHNFQFETAGCTVHPGYSIPNRTSDIDMLRSNPGLIPSGSGTYFTGAVSAASSSYGTGQVPLCWGRNSSNRAFSIVIYDTNGNSLVSVTRDLNSLQYSLTHQNESLGAVCEIRIDLNYSNVDMTCYTEINKCFFLSTDAHPFFDHANDACGGVPMAAVAGAKSSIEEAQLLEYLNYKLKFFSSYQFYIDAAVCSEPYRFAATGEVLDIVERWSPPQTVRNQSAQACAFIGSGGALSWQLCEEQSALTDNVYHMTVAATSSSDMCQGNYCTNFWPVGAGADFATAANRCSTGGSLPQKDSLTELLSEAALLPNGSWSTTWSRTYFVGIHKDAAAHRKFYFNDSSLDTEVNVTYNASDPNVARQHCVYYDFLNGIFVATDCSSTEEYCVFCSQPGQAATLASDSNTFMSATTGCSTGTLAGENISQATGSGCPKKKAWVNAFEYQPWRWADGSFLYNSPSDPVASQLADLLLRQLNVEYNKSQCAYLTIEPENARAMKLEVSDCSTKAAIVCQYNKTSCDNPPAYSLGYLSSTVTYNSSDYIVDLFNGSCESATNQNFAPNSAAFYTCNSINCTFLGNESTLLKSQCRQGASGLSWSALSNAALCRGLRCDANQIVDFNSTHNLAYLVAYENSSSEIINYFSPYVTNSSQLVLTCKPGALLTKFDENLHPGSAISNEITCQESEWMYSVATFANSTSVQVCDEKSDGRTKLLRCEPIKCNTSDFKSFTDVLGQPIPRSYLNQDESIDATCVKAPRPGYFNIHPTISIACKLWANYSYQYEIINAFNLSSAVNVSSMNQLKDELIGVCNSTEFAQCPRNQTWMNMIGLEILEDLPSQWSSSIENPQFLAPNASVKVRCLHPWAAGRYAVGLERTGILRCPISTEKSLVWDGPELNCSLKVCPAVSDQLPPWSIATAMKTNQSAEWLPFLNASVYPPGSQVMVNCSAYTNELVSETIFCNDSGSWLLMQNSSGAGDPEFGEHIKCIQYSPCPRNESRLNASGLEILREEWSEWSNVTDNQQYLAPNASLIVRCRFPRSSGYYWAGLEQTGTLYCPLTSTRNKLEWKYAALDCNYRVCESVFDQFPPLSTPRGMRTNMSDEWLPFYNASFYPPGSQVLVNCTTIQHLSQIIICNDTGNWVPVQLSKVGDNFSLCFGEQISCSLTPCPRNESWWSDSTLQILEEESSQWSNSTDSLRFLAPNASIKVSCRLPWTAGLYSAGLEQTGTLRCPLSTATTNRLTWEDSALSCSDRVCPPVFDQLPQFSVATGLKLNQSAEWQPYFNSSIYPPGSQVMVNCTTDEQVSEIIFCNSTGDWVPMQFSQEDNGNLSLCIGKHINCLLTTEPPDTTFDPPDTTSDPPDTTSDPPDTTSDPPDTTSSPPDTTSSPPETVISTLVSEVETIADGTITRNETTITETQNSASVELVSTTDSYSTIFNPITQSATSESSNTIWSVRASQQLAGAALLALPGRRAEWPLPDARGAVDSALPRILHGCRRRRSRRRRSGGRSRGRRLRRLDGFVDAAEASDGQLALGAGLLGRLGSRRFSSDRRDGAAADHRQHLRQQLLLLVLRSVTSVSSRDGRGGVRQHDGPRLALAGSDARVPAAQVLAQRRVQLTQVGLGPGALSCRAQVVEQAAAGHEVGRGVQAGAPAVPEDQRQAEQQRRQASQQLQGGIPAEAERQAGAWGRVPAALVLAEQAEPELEAGLVLDAVVRQRRLVRGRVVGEGGHGGELGLVRAAGRVVLRSGRDDRDDCQEKTHHLEHGATSARTAQAAFAPLAETVLAVRPFDGVVPLQRLRHRAQQSVVAGFAGSLEVHLWMTERHHADLPGLS